MTNTNHTPNIVVNIEGKSTKNKPQNLSISDAIGYQNQVINQELNITELAEKSKINPFQAVEKPPCLVEYNGISLATLGNFSVLNGKPKSRKTTFGIIISIVALDDSNSSYNGFTNHNPNSNIIYFDTEQAKYDAYRLGNRIVKKLGLTPETSKFSLYGLREYSPAVRMKIIEEVIFNSENLSLVIIDGIADLLTKGYNDESDAIEISSKLLEWSKKLNIHILTVIHQNKGDNYAKGHLGSYLNQKAETVLDIAKSTHDTNISTVKAAFTRGRDIDDIYFSMDENGMPYITDAPVTSTVLKALKRPNDFPPEFRLNLIEEVFKDSTELGYKALQDKLKFLLAEKNYSIGNTILRDWITYYKEKDFIVQSGEKKPYMLNSKKVHDEMIILMSQ